MSTEQIYYQEPYAEKLTARITAIESKGARHLVELDRTIFYPEGGGQPSDRGEVIGAGGRLKVDHVQSRQGRILHQGVLQGNLDVGEEVELELKWNARHHYMRIHTAGHLVHDVLMTLTDDLVPLKGNHGKKAFLQFKGIYEPENRDHLEQAVNQAVDEDHPIKMAESSYEEIQERCRFVPPNLPRSRDLRTLQIGDFDPMPDGGVHVKSTSEIGKVIIGNISTADDTTTIKYRVARRD